MNNAKYFTENVDFPSTYSDNIRIIEKQFNDVYNVGNVDSLTLQHVIQQLKHLRTRTEQRSYLNKLSSNLLSWTPLLCTASKSRANRFAQYVRSLDPSIYVDLNLDVALDECQFINRMKAQIDDVKVLTDTEDQFVRLLANLCKNGYGHCEKKLLQQMDEQEREYIDVYLTKIMHKAQIFDFVTQIPTSINKIHTSVQTMSDAVTNLGLNMEHFNVMCKSVLDKIDNGTTYLSIFTMVAKIVSAVYLMNQIESIKLPQIVAFMTLVLPIECIGNLSSILPSLSRAVQGIISKFSTSRMQAQTDDVQESSIVTSFFHLIKELLFGMYKPMDVDNYRKISMSSNRIHLLASFLRDAKTIGEYVVLLIQKIVETIGDLIVKQCGIIPSVIKTDDIGDLIDKYNKYFHEGLYKSCTSNRNHALQVINLRKQLMDIESELNKKMLSYSSLDKCRIFPYLRVMIKSLDKTVGTIPYHVIGDEKFARMTPFWLFIHGKTRRGKSSMFQPLIMNILCKQLGIRTEFENPANICFSRTCGAPHWDSYDHEVVAYNDLFQVYANQEAMYTAIQELTDVVDDAPLALPIAECEGKNKVFFRAQLVISNSQEDILGQQFVSSICLSGGEHIFARRAVVVELVLNNRYFTGQKVDKMKMLEALRKGVKPCKYIKIVPEDAYRLKFTHPVQGHTIAEYDFDTGIDYIVTKAKDHFAIQKAFKYELYDVMKDIWSAQIDDQPVENQNITTDAPIPNNMEFIEHSEYDDARQCDCANRIQQAIIEKYQYDSEAITTLFNERKFKLFLNQFFSRYHRQHILNGKCCIRINGTIEVIDDVLNKRFCLDKVYANILHIYYVRSGQPIVAPTTAKNVWRTFVDECKYLINEIPIVRIITGAIGCFAIMSIWARFVAQFFPTRPLTPLIDFKRGEAQTSEGNSNKKKKRNKIVRNRNSEVKRLTRGAQIYDDQNVCIESVIKPNFCTLRMEYTLDGIEYKQLEVYMHCLCVGGNVFMLPRHYWHRIDDYIGVFYDRYGQELLMDSNGKVKNNPFNIRLRLYWSANKNTCVELDTIVAYLPEHEHSKDICFFRVKNMCAMKDIRRFFISDDDEPNLVGSYLYGMRSKKFSGVINSEPLVLNVTNPAVYSAMYSTNEKIIDEIQATIPSREYYLPMSYYYENCHTMAGDCGMLFMNTDSKMNAKKIMGMHVAASNGAGAAAMVFSEDIDEAFEFFQETAGDKIITVSPESELMQAEIDDPLNNTCMKLKEIGLTVVGQTKTIDSNGKDKRIRVNVPRKSKVQKSLVFDQMEKDVGPTMQAPAALAPFYDSQGNLISPLFKALEKISCYSQMVSQKDYDLVVTHMSDSIETWKSVYDDTKLRRVLTDFEAINGVEGLKQLDMSTSPGLPYTIHNNSNGKLPWFDTIENKDGSKSYVYKESAGLKNIVDRRIKDAADGLISDTLFADTLKDERRDIDKVTEGKTRLFQIGPMDLTIAMRKYFGAFIGHCHTSYKTGEIAIGINATSYDWTQLYKRQRATSKKKKNGDFAKYDSTLAQQMCMSVADVANAWYDDGPENAQIRRTLIATCVNTYHVIETFVVMMLQGNPSGIVLTTILNCIVNMFLTRYAFIKLTKLDISQFSKYVDSIFYGDDNYESIHEHIIHLYNNKSFADLVATLGMSYTSADKHAPLKEFYLDHETTFLKRKFVKHPKYDLMLAQLDRKVILEIPRWCDGDITDMEDQMNRFNTTLLELTNYGVEDFTKYRKLFVKYCRDLNSSGYNIKTQALFNYDYCFSLMYPDYSNHADVEYRRVKVELYDRALEAQMDDEKFEILSINDTFDDWALQWLRSQKNEIVNDIKKNIKGYLNGLNTPLGQDAFLNWIGRIKLSFDIRKILAIQRNVEKVFQEQLQISINQQNNGRSQAKFTTILDTFNYNERRELMQLLLDMELKEKKMVAQIDDDDYPEKQVTLYKTGNEYDLQFKDGIDLVRGQQFERIMRHGMESTSPDLWKIFAQMFNAMTKVKQEEQLNVLLGVATSDLDIRYMEAQMDDTSIPNIISDEAWNKLKNHRYRADTAHELEGLFDEKINSLSIIKEEEPIIDPVETISTTIHEEKRDEIARPNLYRKIAQVADSELKAQNAKGTVISDAIATAGDFMFMSSLVPGIGAATAPIGAGLWASSRILKRFGFSVPQNIAATMPTTFKGPRYNHVDDLCNADVLNVSQSAYLAKDFTMVHDTVDCMDLVKFGQRPSLLYVGKITSSNTPGQLLYATYLTPMAMVYSSFNETLNPNKMWALPSNALARLFSMWRGSFRFHVVFSASSFHSCRVRIFWEPSHVKVADLDPDHLLNMIVDINESTEVSFTIPYMQSRSWCKIVGYVDVPEYGSNNGSLRFVLMNTLTSGQPVVQPIYYQIFVSLGNDFQFALPTTSNVEVRGTLLAQMDDEEPLFDEALQTECSVALRSAMLMLRPIVRSIKRIVRLMIMSDRTRHRIRQFAYAYTDARKAITTDTEIQCEKYDIADELEAMDLYIEVESSKKEKMFKIRDYLMQHKVYVTNEHITLPIGKICISEFIKPENLQVLVAQMDDKTFDKEKVTTFVEDAPIETEQINDISPRMYKPVVDVNLQNFISRPVLVSSFQWSPTDVLGMQKNVVHLPSALLIDTRMVEKLQGIYMFKPLIEVTYRLNATAFHYGKLMMSVIPFHHALAANYKTFQNASSGEWYQIDAGKKSVLKIIIPFRSHMDACTLSATSDFELQIYSTLITYVSSPLTMASGAATPINVTVHARFLQTNFVGFTNASLVAQMDDDVGVLKSNSFQTLQSMDYPPFPGTTGRGITYSRRNTPFEITSLRQLANMHVQLTQISNDSLFRSNDNGVSFPSSRCDFIFRPYGNFAFGETTNTSGTTSRKEFNCNYFMIVKSMFMFTRGSVRISLTHDGIGCEGDGSYVAQQRASEIAMTATTLSSPTVTSFGNMTCYNMDKIWSGNNSYIQVIMRPQMDAVVKSIFSFPDSVAFARNSSIFEQKDNTFPIYPYDAGFQLYTQMNRNHCEVIIPDYSEYNCHIQSLQPQPAGVYDVGCAEVIFNVPTRTQKALPSYPLFKSDNNTTIISETLTHKLRYIMFMSAGDDWIAGLQLPTLPFKTTATPTSITITQRAARRRRSLDNDDAESFTMSDAEIEDNLKDLKDDHQEDHTKHETTLGSNASGDYVSWFDIISNKT